MDSQLMAAFQRNIPYTSYILVSSSKAHMNFLERVGFVGHGHLQNSTGKDLQSRYLRHHQLRHNEALRAIVEQLWRKNSTHKKILRALKSYVDIQVFQRGN